MELKFVRVIRMNPKIVKTSNSAEGVIKIFDEKNSIKRNMWRNGKRGIVNNKDHTLKHMIPIVQGYG
jgi:hypothetical protein